MDYDNLFAILSYTSRQKKKREGGGLKVKQVKEIMHKQNMHADPTFKR